MVGERSDRVGATRAMGAFTAVGLIYEPDAVEAGLALLLTIEFSVCCSLAFALASSLGLTVFLSVLAVAEYMESPPLRFSISLTISPNRPKSIVLATLFLALLSAASPTKSLRFSVCAAGGISSITEYMLSDSLLTATVDNSCSVTLVNGCSTYSQSS